MSTDTVLDFAALQALATASDAATPCADCAALRCSGWEAEPASGTLQRLQPRGALWAAPEGAEPTLAEHHPAGTHYWSPEAPIAPAFFPANRASAWQCSACGRAFLRYTEYGGYYHEARIRALAAGLLSDAAAPTD